ncbi:DNA topoisomerase 1 [Morella rubra]|uniref:DNA topoisomerase 1 n=1 Tax=Morella rubra TaxID=262757 RepID=A0A6A1W721_9ROSI|nr:DNA topoisomerase 1 [Morella rubra]
MINRSRDEKRKVLNILVEHAIDEAELFGIDPDLTKVGAGPSMYRSCGSDEYIIGEVEFEERRGLRDEESGEKERGWKKVRHDNTVTWLAFWNDKINPKEFKYVFLAASSTLKGQNDKEKYKKARMLKDYIKNIRAAYT